MSGQDVPDTSDTSDISDAASNACDVVLIQDGSDVVYDDIGKGTSIPRT